jgi:(2Fe-2S) ferredoxin
MSYFQHHIFCCTNRREPGNSRGSCAAKGSEELRDYMKNQVKKANIPSTRVNTAGCLDRCDLGPCIVIYPDNVWYHVETKADIDEIIAGHLQQGKIVERLRLPDTATPDPAN